MRGLVYAILLAFGFLALFFGVGTVDFYDLQVIEFGLQSVGPDPWLKAAGVTVLGLILITAGVVGMTNGSIAFGPYTTRHFGLHPRD